MEAEEVMKRLQRNIKCCWKVEYCWGKKKGVLELVIKMEVTGDFNNYLGKMVG